MKSSVLTRPLRHHVIWDYSACVRIGFRVCTLLLCANVILTEMTAFLHAHVHNLGCACTLAIRQSVMFLLSLWSVAMWCGWYICEYVRDHLPLWSDCKPTLSLITTTLRSLAPSSFLTALTFSGQKHSVSLPGCHLSVLFNNPFYRSCSTALSLPHFNLLFFCSLCLKWFRVFFSPLFRLFIRSCKDFWVKIKRNLIADGDKWGRAFSLCFLAECHRF